MATQPSATNPGTRVLRRIIAPITRTKLFRHTAPVWMPHAERAFAKLTRGKLQVSGILVPSLVLHTTGAKSGTPRDSVLMYTPDRDGTIIIAATSFARQQHPAWSYNLLAHPDAAVSIRGCRYPVHAELITELDEREAVWVLIQQQWPGYRAYERDSGRTVRLFRLRKAAN